MLSKLLTAGIVFSLFSIATPKPDRESRFFSEYRLKNLFSSQVKKESVLPEEFKLDLKYEKGRRIKNYDLYKLTD